MHIHIPDGVLPIWLWLAGYLITAGFLAFTLPKLKKEVKKTPLVGMITAIILLVMSIPLGLPTHLNLMVLAGLLVGPWWSLVVSVTLNFVLASFGHGGITIVGLNTILLWFQALVGILLFNFFLKHIRSYSISAGISTFISLIFSFLFTIGIVAASKIEPIQFSHYLQHLGYTQISLITFFLLSFPIALFGTTVESLITAVTIQFIKKVKPDLITT